MATAKKTTAKTQSKTETESKSRETKTTVTKTEKVMDKDMMPKIKVIGIGGSGKNAVNYMIKHDVKGIKFVAVNTDAQDLDQSKASKKIHIGRSLTSGQGTGMNPEVGKSAALENKDEIVKILEDTSIVFITGGMGGGTGTGASPVVAQIARELGILTIAVVTKPFTFEGAKRMTLATEGIGELANHVDAYIVIPNDKILEVADDDTTMTDAFALSDDVLLQAVTGISNLITTPGRINIDSGDVRTVLENQGLSLVGIGQAVGADRAETAASKAINSPLLDVSVKGARSVLFSITAGDDLKMSEVSKIAETVTKEIDPNATVKFGTIRDIKLKKGEIRVIVVASGFEGHIPVAQKEEEETPQEIYKKEADIPFSEQDFVVSDNTIEEEAETEAKKQTDKKDEEAEITRVKKPNKTLQATVTLPNKKEEKKDDKSNDDEDFWSLPSFLKRN